MILFLAKKKKVASYSRHHVGENSKRRGMGLHFILSSRLRNATGSARPADAE